MDLKKYNKHLKFIDNYKKAINASSGSEVDSNANVENKNVATLAGEIFKKDAIGLNRLVMTNKIEELFGKELADEYIRQLDSHEIYRHDETAPVYPYTYSAQESVTAEVDGTLKVISFEDLYDICKETEYLVDEEKIVYCKYPKNMKIIDRDGKFTNISRLVKKKRHRDLVVVKTSNGENLIVTDNHPMIVTDDINNTVKAIQSKGFMQYRDVTNVQFRGKNKIELTYIEKYGESFVLNKTSNANQYSKRYADLTDEFGYFVGFFIAEGWYSKNKNDEYDGLIIKQKNRNILELCAEYLFRSTGIYSYIYEHKDSRGFFTLRIPNRSIVNLFIDEFNISPTAQYKKMPSNIFEYNEKFAYGIISGLIDGDGSVREDGSISLRISSRTCISQLSQIFSALSISSYMSYYDGTQYENKNKLIKESYPMFGIVFNMSDEMYLSKKYVDANKKRTYYTAKEWVEISDVKLIKNTSYLEDNEFIYDITTDSNTFLLNNIYVHNCVSITMYPFLFNGLKTIGGISDAPKNLQSFCGSFINLVFAIASQFAGAVSTPEFLSYLDYFLRKEYGDDYYTNVDKIVELKKDGGRTLEKLIEGCFQQVVYSINQPAAARSFQSVN